MDESLFFSFDMDQHLIIPNRGIPSAFYLRGIRRGDVLSRFEQCPTPERASASSGCPILPILPESSLLEGYVFFSDRANTEKKGERGGLSLNIIICG
jgi:hypothetical protein